MALLKQPIDLRNPFAQQIGDALAPEPLSIATVSVEQTKSQSDEATLLPPAQAHWLATQAKAQILACRTGSCGE